MAVVAAALMSSVAIVTASEPLSVAGVSLGNDAVAVRIGGPGADYARRVRCSPDACVIFGLTLNSYGKTVDFLALGVTPEHRVRWARTYGGTHRDMPEDVPRWARTLDDGAVTELGAVVAWPGGGHVAVGVGPRRGGAGIIAMRIDADGRVAWTRRYDLDENVGATAVLQRGTEVVIAGYTYARKDVTAAVALSLDAEGGVRWARRYVTSPALAPLGIAGHADGSLVLAGPARGDDARTHPAAMKLQADGQWVWTRVFRHDEPGEALGVAAGAAGDSVIVGRRGDVGRNAQEGVAFVVVIAATWTPARATTALSASDAATRSAPLTPTVVSLSPRVVEIQPSQLVSTVIAVPPPGDR